MVAIITMEPPPADFMCGMQAWVSCIVPKKLTSIACRQPSRLADSMGSKEPGL